MVSFLKKIFGKVEQASVQAKDQAQAASSAAKSAADNAAAQAPAGRQQMGSALTNARDKAAGAVDAAKTQATSNPLGAAVAGARDQAAGAVDAAKTQASSNPLGAAVAGAAGSAPGGFDAGAIASTLGGLFSGGMPNLGEIEGAISKLSGGELSGILGQAMNDVPADSRNQLGKLLSTNAPAAAASPGVAAGNPADIGSVLSSLLKGGGLSSLIGIFTGGGAAAAGAAAPAAGASGGGGLLGDVMGAVSGSGGLDLGAIMKNPLAQQVLSAILPAILKAAGK